MLSMLLTMSLSAALLAGLLWCSGTHAPLMAAMMRRYAPERSTKLPESEYGGVAGMITNYLAGRTDEFQYTFSGDDGTVYQCFRPNEQAHMADCRMLFRLCLTVLRAAAGCAAAAALCLALMRGFSPIGAVCGFAVPLTLAFLLMVLGILDFDGLFFRFHQLAFSNDLWLMNPSEDLIIRLMPEQFFAACAAGIGSIWLAASLCGLLVCIRRFRNERKGHLPHGTERHADSRAGNLLR